MLICAIVPSLFYPLLAVGIIIVLGAIGRVIVGYRKHERLPLYNKVYSGISAPAVIAALILIGIYYKDTIVPGGYFTGVSTLWLSVSAAALTAIMEVFAVIFGKKTSKNNDTRAIAFAGICIALSFALSYIRLFRLPQGGSVTLVSLLPLMIYGNVFGVRKAVIACFIYGVLQAIQDPWIIHPAQFLLDYPIAFGMIGLSSIFNDSKLSTGSSVLRFGLGSTVAALLKYLCHVASGMFAFAAYVGEGYNVVNWSFLYNSFALVDMAICIGVGSVMMCNSAFRKELYKIAVKA